MHHILSQEADEDSECVGYVLAMGPIKPAHLLQKDESRRRCDEPISPFFLYDLVRDVPESASPKSPTKKSVTFESDVAGTVVDMQHFESNSGWTDPQTRPLLEHRTSQYSGYHNSCSRSQGELSM
jgi:hypothetical protein